MARLPPCLDDTDGLELLHHVIYEVMVDQSSCRSHRCERFLRLREDGEPILQMKLSLRFGTVEPVLVPKQDLLVRNGLLSREMGVPRHQAHPGTELFDLPRHDLLLCALDAWQHDVAKDRNPMHTFGSQILDRAIVRKVSITSLRYRVARF